MFGQQEKILGKAGRKLGAVWGGDGWPHSLQKGKLGGGVGPEGLGPP